MLRPEEQAQIDSRKPGEKIDSMIQAPIDSGRIGDQSYSRLSDPALRLIQEPFQTRPHIAILYGVTGICKRGGLASPLRVRSFFFFVNGFRPMIRFRFGQISLGKKTRVFISPVFDVHEILFSGQERPLAEALRDPGMPDLGL